MAAVIGGTISEVTGGKFANGAVTAAFAQLFNGETQNRLKKLARERAAREGKWQYEGKVKEGGKRTFRLGHKVKIEGSDDAASLHLNNAAYELTFTEIGADGKPLPGVYPIYEGVLSSTAANLLSTDRTIELYGPPSTKFDWTLIVPKIPKSCDNCGTPTVNIYNWELE